MLKKSLLFGLSVLAIMASTAFSQQFVAMAISAPIATQSNTDSAAAPVRVSAQNSIQLDRSGMDRASVHLQILRQTKTHFADSSSPKKSVADDKKMQVKPANNS